MNIKNILDNNSFVFKKKYGQNFLTDSNILSNIIEVSNIKEDTLVIEIGVGAGALTKKLSDKAKNVIGYEIDLSLKKPLEKILQDYKNIDIIYDDFLKRNIIEDISKYKYKDLMVVANLPYYITTPIITKFIDENIDVSKIIVMVQNEVADRFTATVGTKNYNSLSVFLNYYFDIKKAFFVSRNAFYPKPNVDSAVVLFNKKKERINITDENCFFSLVRDAFKQKRKQLKNNLKEYNLNIIQDVLKLSNKNLTNRAETITLEEFAKISNLITKQRNV